MRAWIGLGLLLVLASTAAAQPGATPPAPYPVYYGGPPPQAAPPGPPLSESTALWWSLGGTIASYGLIAAAGVVDRQSSGSSGTADTLGTIGGIGIFIAPSFGHWYADKYWTRGLALRLGSMGVVVGGAMLALMASPCPLFGGGHDDTEPCDESTSEAIIIVAVIAAGAMFLGGTVDDIVQAPRRVRRYNAARLGGGFTLAPMRTRDATGLALVGRW